MGASTHPTRSINPAADLDRRAADQDATVGQLVHHAASPVATQRFVSAHAAARGVAREAERTLLAAPSTVQETGAVQTTGAVQATGVVQATGAVQAIGATQGTRAAHARI